VLSIISVPQQNTEVMKRSIFIEHWSSW